MNLSDLPALFRSQLLGTAERTMRLQWPASVAERLAPVLLAQRAQLREGICQPFEARIACFTTEARLPLKLFVGMPLALRLDTGRGAARRFPMIVTEASLGRSASHGLAVVNLVGRDPLALLGERRRLRTFLEMSARDVVTAVLDDWIRATPLGGSFAFRFASASSGRDRPRACTVQHPDESDREFVERLLRVDGWAWCWRVDDETPATGHVDALPRLQLCIFDDPRLLDANPTPSMRYHRRDGLQAADSIDLLVPVRRLTPSGIEVRSWDHEAADLGSAEGLSDLDQGEAGNGLAWALASTRYAIDHFGDDAADLQRLAQVQADHLRFGADALHGRGGVRTMAAGTWQAIDDYPPFAGLDDDERSYTTVEVVHVVENNLPAELHDAAQSLAGDAGLPAWALDEVGALRATNRYVNRFRCVPRTAPVVPVYLDERDAPRRRRLTGRVLGDGAGHEVQCDALGRVKVLLLGGEPGADTTAWVRNPVPWGGRQHGWIGVLRADAEVELEWTGADRLVIAGVHYNGATPPPAFDHLGGLPANAALSGVVSRELNGGRTQQLRFDDTPGRIGVQLGSDHAASQLNLGAISTPMDQGRHEPRGEGFELRGDKGGAIRAAEALLVSTWGRLRALGKVLDADEHLALMKDFAELFASLGEHAASHQALPVDAAPATRLEADVRSGTAPTISLSAPAGIATTTPRTLLSYAGVDLDSVAMRHQQLTAGGRFVVNAGNGASIYAHREGVKLIAHHGTMLLQSQHDDTRIESAKDVKLSATGGKLVGVAKEEIVFMLADGTYFRLSAAGIEMGSKQALNVRTASHHWGGPATLASELPSFGDGELGRIPRLLRPTDGLPVEGAEMEVERESGGMASGRTDASGTGVKVTSDRLERLTTSFFFRRGGG